jgi:hypothetical protein
MRAFEKASYLWPDQIREGQQWVEVVEKRELRNLDEKIILSAEEPTAQIGRMQVEMFRFRFKAGDHDWPLRNSF